MQNTDIAPLLLLDIHLSLVCNTNICGSFVFTNLLDTTLKRYACLISVSVHQSELQKTAHRTLINAEVLYNCLVPLVLSSFYTLDIQYQCSNPIEVVSLYVCT